LVFHCLEHADPPDAERLRDLLNLGLRKSPEQVQEILALMHRYGSVDYARDLARRLILEARSYLEALPNSRARATFASMADYFLERES